MLHGSVCVNDSLNWLPHNIRIPMILLSTVTTHGVPHHARCRSLMIHIITDDPVECAIVMMLIRIVVVVLWAVCVVTMTTGCWNLLLRWEMRYWWLRRRLLLLLAIAGTDPALWSVWRSFAIRYETIWCRWWRLATGCSTIGWWRYGWRFLRDLSSNVRLIWFYFTCTAITRKTKKI